MGNLKQPLRRRRGLAAVEAALVLPIILLLSLGLIEYGWLFYKSYQIGNAARVGVRQAAMPNGTTAAVEKTVDDLLAAANIDAGYITRRITPTPVEEVDAGENVTVTIDVAYKNGICLLNAPLIPVPTTLHASATFNKEGFQP